LVLACKQVLPKRQGQIEPGTVKGSRHACLPWFDEFESMIRALEGRGSAKRMPVFRIALEAVAGS
jgi:hypothetical protein